ncbi:hypothetical protein J2S03_001672 [Alicyclobacillus cycloheptanicus]|uniref:ABC-2 family transporter protein n=1 Tax=Alicyclobacillus cycloheptanicus TaxID=1457 RepID=A0ABT9XHQ8_9BACL|nr:hypothetical protein [Alicyclobacillus cycloheptanicus]
MDLVKLTLISLGVSILTNWLFAANGIISSKLTTSYVLFLMYGSVKNFPENWIYWIFICFGYLIILQIVWKSNVHMFEVYQVLRHRNVRVYWRTKLIAGFLVTLCYVICWLATTYIFCVLLHARSVWDLNWIALLACIVFNLYLHALIWLTLRLYVSIQVGLIVVAFLFYAGVRLVFPYVPLYYAMVNNLHQWLVPTLGVELIAIWGLALCIMRHRLNHDFY